MMEYRKAYEKPGLGRHICCFAVLGILLAAAAGIVIDIAVPDVLGQDLIVAESKANGEIGSSIATTSALSQTDIILLNDSDFSIESGWKTDFYELRDDVPRVERTKRESGMQLDISNAAFFCYYEMNLNLRDYELVNLSLDVKALRGPIEVHAGLDIFTFLSIPEHHGEGDGNTIDLSTGESSGIMAQLDTNASYAAWSPLWLAHSRVEISIFPVSSNPYEWGDMQLEASILLENIVITASSNTPLSPLSVDIQNTEGFSVYASRVNLNWRDWPAINVSSSGDSSRWGLIIPWRVDDTIYVAPGSYSGVAGLYSYNYANRTFPVSFDIDVDALVSLGLRFEMIKVTFSILPDVPYLRLTLWSTDVLYYDYYYNIAPPFPETLYIPERQGNLIISLSIPPRVEQSHVSSHYRIEIEVIEPINIDVELHVPLFPILGIMLSTGEVVLVIIGLALLIGTALSLQKPKAKRTWRGILKDPRFWPAFLIGLSAIMPWFASYSSLENLTWSIGEPVLVYRDLYAPFVMGLERTAHSLAVPIVSRYMLVEIPTRIILFWLPLKWAIGHVGRPKKWKFNSYYGAYVLLPPVMGILIYLFTPTPLLISAGFVLVLAAPILWGLEILIYRGFRDREVKW
ncbi:MAG: hypothetical protein ACFFD6_10635 [Candidatus Thorarchaeota archaeon]